MVAISPREIFFAGKNGHQLTLWINHIKGKQVNLTGYFVGDGHGEGAAADDDDD